MSNPADQFILDNIFVFLPTVAVATSALIFVYISFMYQLRKLRRFKRIQFSMVEEERKRIANDLHDYVGGRLVQVREKLLEVIPEIKDQKIAEEVNESVMNIRSFHNDIRHLVEYIYPREMMKGDWRGSFLRMGVDMSTNKTRIQIELEEELELPLETAKQLFLIVQEKITNAVSHEQPSHIVVDLYTSDNGENGVLEMVYQSKKHLNEDYKVKTITVNGRGLYSIDERIKYIRGKMKKYLLGSYLHDTIEFPLNKKN
jgi:signal transduction histidine kinase